MRGKGAHVHEDCVYDLWSNFMMKLFVMIQLTYELDMFYLSPL